MNTYTELKAHLDHPLIWKRYGPDSGEPMEIEVFCFKCKTAITGARNPDFKDFDLSKLDPRFEPYYKSGERIEATYSWSEVERGYIGKSTGWKPCWIFLARKDSRGGPGLSTKAITEIRGLGTYR